MAELCCAHLNDVQVRVVVVVVVVVVGDSSEKFRRQASQNLGKYLTLHYILYQLVQLNVVKRLTSAARRAARRAPRTGLGTGLSAVLDRRTYRCRQWPRRVPCVSVQQAVPMLLQPRIARGARLEHAIRPSRGLA